MQHLLLFRFCILIRQELFPRVIFFTVDLASYGTVFSGEAKMHKVTVHASVGVLNALKST